MRRNTAERRLELCLPSGARVVLSDVPPGWVLAFTLHAGTRVTLAPPVVTAAAAADVDAADAAAEAALRGLGCYEGRALPRALPRAHRRACTLTFLLRAPVQPCASTRSTARHSCALTPLVQRRGARTGRAVSRSGASRARARAPLRCT